MIKGEQISSNRLLVSDEIDLREIFTVLWTEKWVIVGFTSLAAIISVVVAILMTDIYRAEITLASADAEQSAGGLMAQLGGAAALLGVNVGSGGDNISSTLAILQSRQFIGKFIKDNQLLVPLFAANWDKRNQQSQIDYSIYDQDSGEWLLDSGTPTINDAVDRFRQILSVSAPDRNTGIVTVAIEWHNPFEAAEWVNNIVSTLNSHVRDQEVNEANSAIAYLRRQLESTQLVDMQRVFYQLIESQTRIIMLADVRDEYVFKVIDPAVVPEEKSRPRRSMICIVGTLIGSIFALAFIFIRRFFKNIDYTRKS